MDKVDEWLAGLVNIEGLPMRRRGQAPPLWAGIGRRLRESVDAALVERAAITI